MLNLIQHPASNRLADVTAGPEKTGTKNRDSIPFSEPAKPTENRDSIAFQV
jgi:hypothetical protein